MSPDRTVLVGAVDVGGTSIKVATVRVGLRGGLAVSAAVHGEALSIAVPADPDEAVTEVLAAAARAGAGGAVAVGVVLPGVVDEARGVGVWSENIGWRDVDFRGLLRERLAVPVAIGHDVRAWGLAEVRAGAAHGARNAAIVPIGTGIAAALVVDGRLLSAAGFAGEIGHLQVAAHTECACGAVGCLEAVASAAGIARVYNQRTGQDMAGAAQVLAARAGGDPVAAEVWDEAVAHLATALAALATVTAPEVVVLGGGLARAGAALLDPLADHLVSRLRYTPVPRLVPAHFETAGGIVGAAMLAAEAR